MALFNPAPLKKRIAFDLGGEGVGASGNSPLEDYGQGSQAGNNARKALSALKYAQFETWDRAAANDRADAALADQRARDAVNQAFQRRQMDLQQQNADRTFALGNSRLAIDAANIGQNNALRRDQFGFSMANAMENRKAAVERARINAQAVADKAKLTESERTRLALIAKGMSPADADRAVSTGDYSGMTAPLPMAVPREPAPRAPFNPMRAQKEFIDAKRPFIMDYNEFKAKAAKDEQYQTPPRLFGLMGRNPDEDKIGAGYVNYLQGYEKQAEDYANQQGQAYNQAFSPQQGAVPVQQAPAPQQAVPAPQPYQPVTTPALALPADAQLGRVAGLADIQGQQRNALIQRAMRDHGYSPEAAAAAVDEYLSRKG